jgi:DNA-binding response OmpR family regulator
VLLDETMAAADGWQLIRRLRENAVPAIMLVLGPAERQEKIRVLARGADGYLPKPVPPDELSAVVGACLRLLRRVADPRPEDVYDDGLVRMDVGRRQVTVGGTPVALTPLEFRLLHVLIRNRERVVSRGEILETTWHESGDSGGDHVKLYVHYLRRKLAEHTGEELIHTVRGFGYRWVRGERGAATDSAAVPA